MTMQNTDIGYSPSIHMTLGRSVTATFDAIATNSDMEAMVFQIPKTGTISSIHYRIATVTSPVMTHRIELRTVDATTGLPNVAGTLYGGSTSIGVAASTYAANTNYTAAVAATATVGDIVAIVFDLSALTSGSFTQQIQVSEYLGQTNSGRATTFPYRVTGNSPSVPAKNAAGNPIQCFAIEYNDGSFAAIPGVNSWIGTFQAAETLTSTGMIRAGNYFIPRTPRRAIGIFAESQASGSFVYRLRLASNDSILATSTPDKDIITSSTSRTLGYYIFDSGATVNIAAGTAYYVSMEATDTTGCTIYGLASGVSQAMLDICSGGQNCYGFTYTGTTYTTYTSANAVRRYGIGLITDQEDDGVGVGGGGGMRLAGHGGLAA